MAGKGVARPAHASGRRQAPRPAPGRPGRRRGRTGKARSVHRHAAARPAGRRGPPARSTAPAATTSGRRRRTAAAGPPRRPGPGLPGERGGYLGRPVASPVATGRTTSASGTRAGRRSGASAPAGGRVGVGSWGRPARRPGWRGGRRSGWRGWRMRFRAGPVLDPAADDGDPSKSRSRNRSESPDPVADQADDAAPRRAARGRARAEEPGAAGDEHPAAVPERGRRWAHPAAPPWAATVGRSRAGGVRAGEGPAVEGNLTAERGRPVKGSIPGAASVAAGVPLPLRPEHEDRNHRHHGRQPGRGQDPVRRAEDVDDSALGREHRPEVDGVDEPELPVTFPWCRPDSSWLRAK